MVIECQCVLEVREMEGCCQRIPEEVFGGWRGEGYPVAVDVAMVFGVSNRPELHKVLQMDERRT